MKKWNIEDLKEQVEQRGGILISTEYVNQKYKYTLKCVTCGEQFRRAGDKILRNKFNADCPTCAYTKTAQKRARPKNRICENCGGERAHKVNSRFCRACWLDVDKTESRSIVPDFSGERNPAWQGGSINYWKSKVKEANKCDCCGYQGTALNAHHLNSQSAYPDEALDLENGVCLCANCHQEFHTEYGHNVVKEDYLEFKGAYHG